MLPTQVRLPSRSAYRIVTDESRSFTLLELVVVIAIIVILSVLVVPAFTHIKNANNITDAAYTIKGLLEQARNHAVVNSTYVWVGFFEEDGSVSSANPPIAGTGRVMLSTVASAEGTIIYNQPVQSPSTPMDPAKLVQVSKLVRLDNTHLRTFPNGSGTGGDTFATRPPVPGNVPDNAKIGDTSPPDSLRPFQYPVGSGAVSAQYTFKKMIEFTPRGECRVNNINFTIRPILEVGVQPIHGAIIDNNKDCAVQITGFGGNIKVYQP